MHIAFLTGMNEYDLADIGIKIVFIKNSSFGERRRYLGLG